MAKPVLKILVVDDEPLARKRLCALCARYENTDQTFVAEGGEDALEKVDEFGPDVLLLDVDMPDLSGMDVANICRGMDDMPEIIFTTAHSHYAVDAFRLEATDYLLKPVKMALLTEALDKVVAKRERRLTGKLDRSDYRIWVRDGDSSIQIQSTEIERVEAERDYMRLCLEDRSYLVHDSMGSLEEKLPQDIFIRVHRSTILRRDFIKEIRRAGRRHFAVLMDDSEIAIGPLYIENVTPARRSRDLPASPV